MFNIFSLFKKTQKEVTKPEFFVGKTPFSVLYPDMKTLKQQHEEQAEEERILGVENQEAFKEMTKSWEEYLRKNGYIERNEEYLRKHGFIP